MTHPILGNQYAGSCVVCLRGTDTGIACEGELEWLAAFLTILGVPRRDATTIVENSDHEIDGTGRGQVTFRVCQGCAAEAETDRKSLPQPALIYVGGEIPCVRQPEVWA